MLKKLASAVRIIGLILAAFALITGRFVVMPYVLFLLGVMFLIMGLQEKQKSLYYPQFIISGFIIFISIYTFLFN
ncbi:hypothetical protein [Bacillus sp. EAC]|uniref:hypothetical protein n=1 Tax=Bacillus sp. EAC TaxID=1978338 RepID=UPI000B445A4C|nr:hypothetical protein [Bacillus sp. EAC]